METQNDNDLDHSQSQSISDPEEDQENYPHLHPDDEDQHQATSQPQDSTRTGINIDQEPIHYVHIKVDPDAETQTNSLNPIPPEPLKPAITIPSLIPLRDITKCSYQDYEFCSNCYQKITEIKVGKKFSDVLCPRRGMDQNITVLEALNMIFELEQKSWLSETILDPNYQICFNCTSSLTQLYKRYVDFAGLTHKPSYISSIVRHNLILAQHRRLVPKLKLTRLMHPKAESEIQDYGDHGFDDYEALEFEDTFQESELPIADSFILPDKIKKSKRTRTRSSTRKNSTPSRKTRKSKSIYVEDDIDDEPVPTIDDDEEFIPETPVETDLHEGEDDYDNDYPVKTRKRKLQSISSPLITSDAVDSDEAPAPKRRHKTEGPKKYKCEECHVGFSKPFKLKRHLNVHSQPKYKCEVCNAGFKHSFILRKHMELHDENRKENSTYTTPKSNMKLTTVRRLTPKERRRALVCKDCGIVFSCGSRLKRHTNFQHNSLSSKYTCPEVGCTIVFKNASTMDRHRVAAHGLSESILDKHGPKTKPGEDYIIKPGNKSTRRYQCPQCPATFLRTDHIIRHAVVHREKNFTCNICNAGFRTQNILGMHMKRIHEEPSPKVEWELEEFDVKPKTIKTKLPKSYPCEESKCDSSFTCLSHYKRHLIRVHNKELPKPEPINPTPCPVCKTVFQTSSKLEKHLLNYHRPMVRENKFECETCGKKYRDRNNLRNHQASHRLDRPFLCDLCGFTTKRSYQLTRHHDMVHIGLRPHLCTTCGMSFKKKQHLRDHETKHFESSHRPYVCEIEGCTKAYRSRRNLRQHLESHLGCKFICETCGRIFTRKDNLKVHVDTLHLGKPGRTAKDKEKIEPSVSASAVEDGTIEAAPRPVKSPTKPRKPRKSRAKIPISIIVPHNNEADEEDEFEDENPPPPPGAPSHFQPHHILQIQQGANAGRQILLNAHGAGAGPSGAIISNQFGEFFYM